MPIEIKELHINVLVDDTPPGNAGSSTGTQIQINDIVAECVEQVLTILKEKQER